MNYLMLSVMVLVVLLRSAAGQDVVKVAPKNCVVQLDDERVRVIEVTMQPGDTLPYHTHPEYILVPLTEGKLEQQHRGEEPVTIELIIGKTTHRSPEIEGHMARNVGNTVTRVLNIELKPQSVTPPK